MDEETVIGIQKMREAKKTNFVNDNLFDEVCEERDEYKKALEDILQAHTVGKMIEIASRVLRENRKWSL